MLTTKQLFLSEFKELSNEERSIVEIKHEEQGV